MTDTAVLNRRSLRAPARVDESKLSQALQDLFASWRLSLKQDFKGLTATGEVVPDLFPLHSTPSTRFSPRSTLISVRL
jgi:hypothetical protein